MKETKVSLWRNIRKPGEVELTTLMEVLGRIKSDELKAKINAYRADKDNSPDTARTIKESLPAITPSGTFSKRRKSALIEHNGIISIDYDHIPLNEVEAFKQGITENPYTLAVFISPSGEGVKVLVKTDSDEKNHKDTYLKWNREFPSEYFDETVNDFSRLMFLSWDPEIYVNWDSEVYESEKSERMRLKEDAKKERERLREENKEPSQRQAENERLANPKNKLKLGPKASSFETRDMYAVLETVIPKLPSHYADNRNTWIAGINALISEFGENARTLVHLFSSLSSKYKKEETDEQFDYEYNKFSPEGAQIGTLAYWSRSSKIPFYSEHELMFKNGMTAREVALELDISEEDARKIKAGIRESVKTPALALEFIRDNHDFRTNMVTGMIESQSTEKVINPNEMYTELLQNGYDTSPSQINAICRSPYIAPEYDPIKEYLESLKSVRLFKTDPFKNIDKLSDAIVLEDESEREWFKHMLRKMLVRTVACGMGKIPNRTVFVLTDNNRQNIGKSTWIRYIGGLDVNREPSHRLWKYYLEEELKNDKDMDIAVCENFIWNVEEYESLNPRDLSKFKMTVSKANSKVRRPYAAFAENLSRRCSFFASTNHDEMLSDGKNTRYIIFRVKDVKRNYQEGKNKVCMDNVWAEAYQMFKENPSWGELDRDDLIKQDEMNREHKISDPLEDYILNICDHSQEWLQIPAAIFNQVMSMRRLSRSAQHTTKIIKEYPNLIRRKRTADGRFIEVRATKVKVGEIYSDANAEIHNPYLVDTTTGNSYMTKKSFEKERDDYDAKQVGLDF